MSKMAHDSATRKTTWIFLLGWRFSGSSHASLDGCSYIKFKETSETWCFHEYHIYRNHQKIVKMPCPATILMLSPSFSSFTAASQPVLARAFCNISGRSVGSKVEAWATIVGLLLRCFPWSLFRVMMFFCMYIIYDGTVLFIHNHDLWCTWKLFVGCFWSRLILTVASMRMVLKSYFERDARASHLIVLPVSRIYQCLDHILMTQTIAAWTATDTEQIPYLFRWRWQQKFMQSICFNATLLRGSPILVAVSTCSQSSLY